MIFSLSGFIYHILIDPILSRLHDSVLINIEPATNVIDIACGTGSISMAVSQKVTAVTGIDISPDMISTALRSAAKRGLKNVKFELHDASNLSDYSDHSFDVAITSMSVHQFDADMAVEILREMKRIAPKIILLDYNWPMTRGFSSRVTYIIERFAGGDHFRNFVLYMDKGGLPYFIARAGLKSKTEIIRGNGVFLIAVCE